MTHELRSSMCRIKFSAKSQQHSTGSRRENNQWPLGRVTREGALIPGVKFSGLDTKTRHHANDFSI